MNNTLKNCLGSLVIVLILASCSDRSGRVTPEKLGLSSDSLTAAKERLQQYIDEAKLSGISALVLKDGEVAYRSLHGYADLEGKVEMQEDQIFRIFSMSKPVTTAALMILYEEGKFLLDDPVANYLPEYEETEVYLTDTDPPVFIPQNEPITIRHLLTHTAGFTYGWDPYSYVDSLYQAMEPNLWELNSLEEFSKRMTGLPLKYQPGSRWEYSISIDVAGYLVEILSGLPFDEFLKTKIFEPLGMDDTGFRVPEADQKRLAKIYVLDYDQGELAPVPLWTEGVINPVTLFSGGGGLVSTIEDYGKFGQMLVNGGELNGVRILDEKTVKLMMSDQLPEGVVYQEGIGYGLGGSVNLESGTYHWSGMASTAFWADPANNMVILCFTQFIPNQKYPFAREFREKVMG
ncbi:MAG: serine hydrolase domain-containing protein, partial [Bacteroidales bacterium]